MHDWNKQIRVDLAPSLLSSILESSRDAILTVDLGGVVIAWNHAAERLFDRRAEEVVGQPLTTVAFPPGFDEVLQHVEQTKLQGAGDTLREVRLTKAGIPLLLDIVLSPVKDEEEEVVGVALLARDVAEARVKERDSSGGGSHESREVLETLADAVPQMIWRNDAEGKADYFNQRWYDYSGLTYEQSEGLGWQAIVHPDDALGAKARWGRAFVAGEVFESEYRLRGADGSYRWFLGRNVPVRDESGEIVCWFGSSTDIHDLKTAETAFRESQERLRLIVENARGFAIFSQNLDRTVASWNSGAESILGYSEQEVLGKSGDLIFVPEDRAAGVPAREAEAALAQGQSEDTRWHMRKDGTRFWANGVQMAMKDVTGKPVGLVKILRDQTSELVAKEALQKSHRELSDALQEAETARMQAESAGRAKDHFLAVLSHELRTPLTPVMLAVRTLSRRKDLPPADLWALDMITRNVEMEARLIDDILDLTRITQGKLDLERKLLDVHEVIRHAVHVSESDISAKQQQLTVTLEAAEHSIVGDAARLQQVFWNLLKNASKFSPEGSQISLSSRNVGQRITVEISDAGIGFQPGSAERIFEPFTQEDETITREFGGLGLGLAIARATIDAHGGKLQAVSAGRGQGATFIVELLLE